MDIPEHLIESILALRADGVSYETIAKSLKLDVADIQQYDVEKPEAGVDSTMKIADKVNYGKDDKRKVTVMTPGALQMIERNESMRTKTAAAPILGMFTADGTPINGEGTDAEK